MKKLAILFALLLAVSLFSGKNNNAVVCMSDTETITVGEAVDNTYWNDSISLGCTLDEEWYFLTMDEILEVNGYVFSQLEGDIGEILQNAENFTCMYAINFSTNASVNVGIEKLNAMNAIVLSEKKYAEIAVGSLEEALNQMGAENLKYEITEVKIDGEDHAALKLSFQNEGNDVYEVLGIIKHGSRMIIISTATFGEDTCMDILSSFTRTAPEGK